MVPVATEDIVVAKHKNGRYYRAVVQSVSDVVYYKVAFDDGTYSNDMYPEDIEVSYVKDHITNFEYYSFCKFSDLIREKTKFCHLMSFKNFCM